MASLCFSNVWLKLSPIRSRVSEFLSRPCRSLRFGRLVKMIVQLYAIFPIDADFDPRCGVPRKHTPYVAGAIALSRVPTVDED